MAREKPFFKMRYTVRRVYNQTHCTKPLSN